MSLGSAGAGYERHPESAQQAKPEAPHRPRTETVVAAIVLSTFRVSVQQPSHVSCEALERQEPVSRTIHFLRLRPDAWLPPPRRCYGSGVGPFYVLCLRGLIPEGGALFLVYFSTHSLAPPASYGAPRLECTAKSGSIRKRTNDVRRYPISAFVLWLQPSRALSSPQGVQPALLGRQQGWQGARGQQGQLNEKCCETAAVVKTARTSSAAKAVL